MKPDVYKNGNSKGEKPLTLILCPRCVSDFRNSGHFLIKKGWQEVKETCDYCNVGKGFTYEIYKEANHE